FGEGQLHAQLSVRGLDLVRRSDGTYIRGFDPRYEPDPAYTSPTISADAILATARPQVTAGANVKVNYFSAKDRVARITTSLLNSLLRCLGHAVLSDRLEERVQRLLAGG